MVQQLALIFANLSSLLLIGALVAALFFAGAGLRELRSRFLQGLLFIGMAVFFLATHLYYFWNIPEGTRFAAAVHGLDFWGWGAVLLTPALIIIYLLRGIFDMARFQRQAALTQLFFGLTLLCFAYMVGRGWPADVKSILTGFYGFAWVEIERSAG